MKKLFYLSLALCFFTTLASAQKVTQKDLQGVWALQGLESEGIYFDLVKEDVIIPDEIKGLVSADDEAQMRMAIPVLKDSFMKITDNKIEMNMGPDGDHGVFTLATKDNKNMMTVTMSDGVPDDSEVFFKDKLLHIINYVDGQKESELIYVKK